MNKLKKWFTLIELVVSITIISIISLTWYNIFKTNEDLNISNSYINEVINRINELQSKSLIWINWYYNNKWVTKPEFIKVYCKNDTKSFNAYICDNKNIPDISQWDCSQIDFPSFSNLKIDWYFKNISDYNIKKCEVNNLWSYIEWSFYIKINLNFPYWKIEYYNDNWTIDNYNDDVIIENWKIHFWNNIQYYFIPYK